MVGRKNFAVLFTPIWHGKNSSACQRQVFLRKETFYFYGNFLREKKNLLSEKVSLGVFVLYERIQTYACLSCKKAGY